MTELKANNGKNEVIKVNGVAYRRLPIHTHLITADDKIEEVAQKYAGAYLQKGDVLFISEKCVACTQRRAIPMEEIRPHHLAKVLSKFVYKSPYGIGLSIPETMEMALQECGKSKILFAAGCSAIGKLCGKRGVFYQVAGDKARAIDGPCDCTVPPYNHYVVLGPLDPDGVAWRVKKTVGAEVCVVDINDLSGKILGVSESTMNRALLAEILKDNPLGQSNQQTPMGIIRRI